MHYNHFKSSIKTAATDYIHKSRLHEGGVNVL